MLLLNGKEVELGHFPDGTLLIKQEVPKDYDTARSATVTW